MIVEAESALNPRYLNDDAKVQLDCTTWEMSREGAMTMPIEDKG